MAGNLPLLNGVEVKLEWALSGSIYALNILHFNNPSGAAMTQTLANSIDSAVKSAFTTSGLGGQLATIVNCQRADSRSMTSNTDPWFYGSGAAIAGTGTGKPLPAATALVVTNRTGLRGRSYNGRTYLWGWADVANDVSGGATSAAVTAAAAFITAIRTTLAGATPSLILGVVSRFTTLPATTLPVERNPPVITPVTASLCLDQRWDTQRRRAIPGV